MNSLESIKNEGLDLEWIELMKMALEIGLSIEEVQNFLNKNRKS
ncbi:anti-repressor SinI family protein [Metabacillus halosaccharovorans]|uniref:Anti-repressor SinI family protein n=1 Tax=Metabacillus halosaccharovorans TaxID=930124 RepID=A0ABT3DLP7_9BACI|nr:anti-repressor SinI family protein [Metabacillus halosaccharovorans]MCV9887791.1 anti-repressor SinI family protein [Metabacillus halosaccharovorans]